MTRGRQSGYTVVELAVMLLLAAVLLTITVAGIRNGLAAFNRNGAAREVTAQIRNAQSAAVTRNGVYAFQWGGDSAVNYPQSQFRLVRDAGSCALPAATAAKDDTNVLTFWTDLSTMYPGTKIQSVVDNNGLAVGKLMFSSTGASVNTCTTANFPITVTVSDSLGKTRQIQIRSAGSVTLL